jgi:tetratricopeptide (TPR) repeat protein
MHTRSLLILAVLVLIPQLSIAGESAEWCDQQWGRLSAGQGGGSGQDYNKLLAEWQKLEAKCKGTGLYEARLATVHVLLGQYAKARDVLDPILRNDKLPGNYRAMAEMVRLNADSREAHARTEPDRKQLVAIEKRVVKLIEQHPHYSPFYLFLGNLRLELGDYRGAIGPLEKMSRFEDGNRWDV